VSDTEEPRGGTIRRRLLTAFAAVAVPPVLLLAALVLVLLSRSFERTAASRLQDGTDAVFGRLARMEDVARVKVAAVAREDLPVAADADLPGLAGESGERRDLPVLEIVSAEGTILSSLHWPVGFGLREQDRTFEGVPRFRMEKVSEGYGATERLALVAERPASLHGREVVVRGGSFVDGALLDELSRLMGAAVAVRDEAGRRWIAADGSPLATWTAPPGGAGQGEVSLRGESFRWQATPLAPGLSLVVAIPGAAIVEVMGGVGRSTLIAAIAALAGALLTRLPSARASWSRSPVTGGRSPARSVRTATPPARAAYSRSAWSTTSLTLKGAGWGGGMRANWLNSSMILRSARSSSRMVRLDSRNWSARRRPLASSSATRRRVSIESWMGKMGFFSSWARRLAISRQAATRSACSSRSRCSTS